MKPTKNAKFIVLELLYIPCLCMFNILSRTKSYQFQIKVPIIFPCVGGEARGGDIPYTLSAPIDGSFSSVLSVLLKYNQELHLILQMHLYPTGSSHL